MRTPRFDITQPDYYPPEAHYRWIDGYGDPVRAAKRKAFLRIVVIGGGALAIMLATFLIVAAHELVTSQDARLVAQAAKDRTRATTLGMATDAKCDREVVEAKAAGQPVPACAQEPAEPGKEEDSIDAGAILEGLIKAAAG